MNSIDKLVVKYLCSRKSIEEFLETIESTDAGLQTVPQHSPLPNDKEEEEEEDK